MLCLNCKTKTKNKKFCSSKCSAIANNSVPKRKLSKICQLCDNLIRSNKTYCKICWNTRKTEIWKKPKTYKDKKRIVNREPKICKFCNKQFKTKDKTATFCSKTCSIECKFLEKCNKVEADGFLYSSSKFDTSVLFAKKYLRRKYGNCCSICNQTSTWNSLPLMLILDHINGTSNDWSIENLRLVCPNCDSQLPTFKGKNKGKGRPQRNKKEEDEGIQPHSHDS